MTRTCFILKQNKAELYETVNNLLTACIGSVKQNSMWIATILILVMVGFSAVSIYAYCSQEFLILFYGSVFVFRISLVIYVKKTAISAVLLYYIHRKTQGLLWALNSKTLCEHVCQTIVVFSIYFKRSSKLRYYQISERSK